MNRHVLLTLVLAAISVFLATANCANSAAAGAQSTPATPAHLPFIFNLFFIAKFTDCRKNRSASILRHVVQVASTCWVPTPRQV